MLVALGNSVRVLITGVTGLIGSRLALWLHAHGHKVIGVSRHPDKARRLVPTLDEVRAWDPIQGPLDPELLNGVEAIVHLAGESLAKRWSKARKAAFWESRVSGTKHLVQGLLSAKSVVRSLVSASAVGFYGQCGAAEITEHSPPGQGFIPELVRAWEEEARKALDAGIRVVHARFGLVLWRSGGILKHFVRLFKLGLGGRIGGGEQWWPWVHLDDVAGFIEKVLLSEVFRGAYNVVSPRPVQQAVFAETLARVLGRPAFFNVPGWVLRVFLGEGGLELLKSQRVIPYRTTKDGFTFRYEDLDFALQDLLRR